MAGAEGEQHARLTTLQVKSLQKMSDLVFGFGVGSLGFGIFCRDLDLCRDLTSKYLIPAENNPANIGCKSSLT